MMDGSSGGGTFNANGELVAVNQMSTRLHVWQPANYKAYSRSLSELKKEHGLVRSP